MIKNRIIYNDASDWQFDIKKASGVYLWTGSGRKLLDFTSGWNVTNLGWNNKEISDALIKQAKENVFSPMENSTQVQKDLACLLTDSLPKGLTSVGRTTGGVESNEEAIKTAKAYTKRKKILGFHHSYHGQSILMMSLVLNAEEMKAIGPQYSNMIKMSFPSVYNTKFSPKTLLGKFENDLQQKLKNEDVAAFITEPGIITGWGSTYIAPRGFLKIARKLTKKYGTLFIVDEVGTGFSRCGALYGMNLEGVIPDIVTFAKGFSNGAAAIGAMVTTDEISGKTWKESNLQSTFGWLPVSCAAAKKNLELHLRDKVWQKSEEDGMYIRDILDKELGGFEQVGKIRGLGMEIGLSFIKDREKDSPDVDLAKKIVKKSKKRGIYILHGSSGNIQLMPPLVMERRDIDKGLDILITTIKKEVAK